MANTKTTLNVVSVKTENRTPPPARVEHFSLYKGKSPMVRISGNFYGGGFNFSQGKLRAIIQLLKENPALVAFAKGDYDETIKGLDEGQVARVE